MQYNPDFVNPKSILRDADKRILHSLAKEYSLGRFLQDSRNFEELMVDFVYTSAKIEGNTYSRMDTDSLLRLGITAGGKRYSDAKMLLNLRSAFNTAMVADGKTAVNEAYVCDLHQILMADLLPVSEQGIVRKTPVTIGATSYRPLTDPARLKTEMKAILENANQYSDVFERAIYLHCNLAYLQFFQDGNKRTARMMQTVCLVQGGVLPLFFRDTLIDDYARAVVNYYEAGSYDRYVDFFKTNYTLVAADMTGSDVHDLQKKTQRLAQTILPK